MMINGQRMSHEQFEHCMQAMRLCNIHLVSVTVIETGIGFLESTTGRDCFEIKTNRLVSDWATVIHDTESDEIFYYRDNEFNAHHYASKKAFELAKLAHGGIACKVCGIHHRDELMNGICVDCGHGSFDRMIERIVGTNAPG